jgi:hypothetical protein
VIRSTSVSEPSAFVVLEIEANFVTGIGGTAPLAVDGDGAGMMTVVEGELVGAVDGPIDGAVEPAPVPVLVVAAWLGPVAEGEDESADGATEADGPQPASARIVGMIRNVSRCRSAIVPPLGCRSATGRVVRGV